MIPIPGRARVRCAAARLAPLVPPAALVLALGVGVVACKQDAAVAEAPAPSQGSSVAEGKTDMERSTGKSSTRADLGPAPLAFDRFGLIPEDRFDAALRAVTEAERAYAAQAADDGMKAASLHWMRADATVFHPEPAAAAASFAAWDERTQPRLAWAPQRVEVSAAGDLAVSTGPYRVEAADPADARHGQYFSVWQRQEDGSWRVIADLGTPHAQASTWPTSAWGHRVDPKAPRASVVPQALPLLEGLEQELAESAEEFGPDAALARHATDAIHLMRAGVPPRAGREFLAAEAGLGAAEASSISFELAGAAASTSNDLAAGWGVSTNAQGHRDAFVRVWRREETDWRVAFDVRVPLP